MGTCAYPGGMAVRSCSPLSGGYFVIHTPPTYGQEFESPRLLLPLSLANSPASEGHTLPTGLQAPAMTAPLTDATERGGAGLPGPETQRTITGYVTEQAHQSS